MEIQIWNLFNEALKKRVGIASFNRWLSQLKPVKHHANKLVLVCPNKFVLDWVKLNYHNDLMTAFHQVTGEEVLVDFIAHSDNNGNGNNKETPSPSQLALPGTERYLTGLPFINREYTFQNFIVGPGNQLAYASALAVTDKERLYNPLFFYSPEGLGKTHLSSAVGQKIYSTHPDVKVFYTTAEWFTHEMIQRFVK
jgi:ATPase involved in DNA replication initiation